MLRKEIPQDVPRLRVQISNQPGTSYTMIINNKLTRPPYAWKVHNNRQNTTSPHKHDMYKQQILPKQPPYTQ